MSYQSTIISILVSLWITTNAWAGKYDHDDARRLRDAGDIVSLESIIDAAKTHRQGRIIEVELETKRDKIIYEVEIVDEQGIVWELKFNAQNGQLLEHKKDD
ncbi:MAG: peptidase [Gammaproteobacteria bacterium]|nr:peptidase [Gammaproteobacteria bacterium]